MTRFIFCIVFTWDEYFCFFISQPVKGVSQNINYTTTALLPVLTSLFDHIAQHQFGDDVIRKDFFEKINAP